ncbi:hypothetical protein LEP1GSC170_0605 [Leptospira interrogans serovar Bataviae str. HAI135]|nr:hypothetical protein LEP1GSC170_0605 [Leptospira interrogans serovar Bataviae str. HAI135]
MYTKNLGEQAEQAEQAEQEFLSYLPNDGNRKDRICTK